MNENFGVDEFDFKGETEIVYDLTNFDIEGELIISDTEKYIIANNAYFNFKDQLSIKQLNDLICIENQDGDKIKLSKEHFEIIQQIVESKN